MTASASGRDSNGPGFSFGGLRPDSQAKRKVQLRSVLCRNVRSPLQEHTRAWSAHVSSPMSHAGQCEGEGKSGMQGRRRMAIRKREASSTGPDSLLGMAWSQAPNQSADINCVCALTSTFVCGNRSTVSTLLLSSLAQSTFRADVSSRDDFTCAHHGNLWLARWIDE